jgi:FecR protein/Putative zinc-finger
MKIFDFLRSKRDSHLDQAIAEVREDQPDTTSLSASAERVWKRIQAGDGGVAAATPLQMIQGCADIRALLPAFYKHELQPARASIVEDHLRECVSCRSFVHGRGLEADAAAKWQMETPADGARWTIPRPLLVAAAAAMLVGLVWAGASWYFAGLPGASAWIASADGQIFAVSAKNIRMLKPGDEVDSEEFIRTAAASHATVKLLDGSDVEMNQRAEFAVTATRRDTTIELNQGSIIVHAAKRHRGHLYVSAPDCRVAVTGTMFAVNSGTKGSRVTVIEGEVHVTHSGQESVLRSGDQLATTQAVALVPVREEIAWSHDLDHELALLAEFSKLREKFEQISTPPARYESKILPLLPQDTILYVSIPNLGEALQQANQIFQQQLVESPVLQQWWGQVNRSAQQITPEELIAQVPALSQFLGDEVVITMSGGSKNGPVLLSEIRQPGLEDFLQNHLASGFTRHDDASDLHVVNPHSFASLADNTRGMVMLVRQNMFIVGGDADSVRQMSAQIDGGTTRFGSTDFAQRILGVYSGGAETLLAINFAAILNTPQNSSSKAFLTSGFNNVKYLVATRSATPNHDDNRLTLEFAGARRGIPSWLAEPAPMGSLDYVSANAGAAFSVVAKQPALMLDDLFNTLSSSNPNFSNNLAEMNTELGFDLRNDLASALDGEMTLSLDGPLLPTPSWKIIVEVNNPGALQLLIERSIRRSNQEAQGSQAHAVTLEQQQIGGRTFYTIHMLGPGLATECDYTFADGYMLLAPSRALLLAALDTHSDGSSLARSASFRSLLPSDNQANFSGMLYQNLSPILKPLASEVTSQQFSLLQQLAADSKPSVICAYGETDRIEVATNGKLLDLNPGMMTLFRLLGQADHGTSAKRHP